MEDTVFRPDDLVFTRSDDPSEDLKLALKGLVASAPFLRAKYIRMSAEVLAAASGIFGLEINSDGEVFLGDIQVLIVYDLSAPFELVCEKTLYQGIVFHDSINNQGIYGGRY